ncbi:MAG: methyltransferase domain-containing protein [Dehalococcoidales bacterium]
MHDTDQDNYEPAPFLVENIALLPKGHILDVAMGYGRNAIYLAGLGFQVDGVDISAAAVAYAEEAARKSGVSISVRAADLEGEYKIEVNWYDGIICFSYLQRSLIPQIKAGLRRGGVVVYETFLVDQAQWGKPKNPDYLLKHNELLEMFRDFRCLRYREGVFENGKDRRAIASIVAEKP